MTMGSGCARSALVSADRANQGGKRQTEGCPELWVMRRCLPRPRTRRGLNGGRGTVAVFGERRWSLSGHVRRVREGARGSAEGASERGKWASRARGSKGARMCRGGRRTRGRGRVHGEGHGREVGDGLTGGVREIERERASARARGTTPKRLAHWAAGGRDGRERAGETG
jgi:hypothetical protein